MRLEWDANVGARAGHLLMVEWLVYGTAGLALQQVESAGACVNPTFRNTASGRVRGRRSSKA